MTKTQQKLYQHPKWQRKRLEIMQRDDFKCSMCGENEKTLNVHHKEYEWGNKPWEYKDNNFITLCEKCHKLEHKEKELKKKELAKIRRDIHKNEEKLYPQHEEVLDIKASLCFMYNLEEEDLVRLAINNFISNMRKRHQEEVDSWVGNIKYWEVSTKGLRRKDMDEVLLEAFDEIKKYHTAIQSLNTLQKLFKEDRSPNKIYVTDKLIEDGKSCNGGWSNKQMELLGVTIAKGWKVRAIGNEITKENAEQFIAIRKTK